MKSFEGKKHSIHNEDTAETLVGKPYFVSFDEGVDMSAGYSSLTTLVLQALKAEIA